jgi:hypothetical protein
VDRLNTPIAPDGDPIIVVAGGAGTDDAKLDESIRQEIGADIIVKHDVSLMQQAAEAAFDKQTHAAAGWVDFRAEALARKTAWRRRDRLVHAAAILGLAFALTCIAVLWVRGSDYARLTEQYRNLQAEEFRRLYPGAAVPTDIASRLQSQHRLHAAVSGSDSDMPAIPSALDSLRQAIANLPKDVKYRVTGLRVTPGGIVMQGQTLTHSDAESVSTALGREGFRTQPPRTESLRSGGISFTINAVLPER